MLCKLEIKL